MKEAEVDVPVHAEIGYADRLHSLWFARRLWQSSFSYRTRAFDYLSTEQYITWHSRLLTRFGYKMGWGRR